MKPTEQTTNNNTTHECLDLDDFVNDPETNDQPPTAKTEKNGETEVKPTVKRKNRPNPTRSDVGFSKLKLEYRRMRKLGWCVVVVISTSICLWQMILRIQEYIREPTSFQVKVERMHEIQFPAITICPAREPFHEDTWRQSLDLMSPSEYSILDSSMSEAWKTFAITKEDISAMSSCDDKNVCNFIDGVSINLKTIVIPTLWGLCFTLSRDKPMPYRGASTYIEIILRPGTYGRQRLGQNVAAQFFFHDPQAIHSHEAFMRADFWSLGRETLIHLTLKKFDFLNISRNPCDTEANVIECKNNCFEEKLDRIVKCRLPFMMAKWPPCRNAIEAKQAFDNIRDFYYTFNSSDCVCLRQCQQNVYSTAVNTIGGRLDNRTSIRIQYSDNLVEELSEEFAYTSSALVSDLGGCLGIFLGLSFLSLIKKSEQLLQGIKKKT